MRVTRNFCQLYLVLSLFYSLKRGSNGFIAEKQYLYFTKDPEKFHYIPRGGVQLFSGGGGGGGGGGVQMLISIETHIRTCYFPGGGVSEPPIPL